MLDFDVISTIIGIFGGLGVLIAGVAYGVSSWKNGSNSYKEELIKDLKDTVAQKDCIIARINQEKSELIIIHQKQINDLQKEMSKLQGRLEEQSKKLEMYSEILENRDPKTLEILTEIKNGMDILNKHQVTQEANVKEVAIKAETVRTDLKNKKI